MFIPLLVIGTAGYGPDSIPIKADNLSYLKTIFRWVVSEDIYVGSTQASAELKFDVWGNRLKVYNLQNKKRSLHYPDVSGRVVKFGAPGASGFYTFEYIRTPKDTDIIVAAESISNQSVSDFYVLRVPGNKSRITIGDLVLESEFSGEINNNITAVVTGGFLTIGQLSYSLSDPIAFILQNINADFNSKKHPFFASCSSLTPTIPNGVYLSSGGSDGEITEEVLDSILNLLDLNSVGTILLTGRPASGLVDKVLEYIDNDEVPTCLICNSYSDKEEDLSLVQYLSNKLFYVLGEGKISNPNINNEIPLSYVFSALWVKHESPTNKKSSLINVSPLWTTEQIHQLGDRFCLFNKFIISGFSPWRSSPTNGENPLINKVKIDISKRIFEAFDKYVGEPSININLANNICSRALDGVENVSDIKFSCEVAREEIIINISALVYGEINYIDLKLVTRRDVSG